MTSHSELSLIYTRHFLSPTLRESRSVLRDSRMRLKHDATGNLLLSGTVDLTCQWETFWEWKG